MGSEMAGGSYLWGQQGEADILAFVGISKDG